MVRLNDAQKKIIPSGTTFCHSSMAGSGRWSMFSEGTYRQDGGHRAVYCHAEDQGSCFAVVPNPGCHKGIGCLTMLALPYSKCCALALR